EAWQEWADVDGNAWAGERRYGDIAEFAAVHAATKGMDGVLHLAAYFGQGEEDALPWLVNLKGLWNVLESARRRGVRHVVHVGSRETVHPNGVFFERDMR